MNAHHRELTHDRLAPRFDELMDDYDLGRRRAVLIDRFLGPDIRGKLVLDAGCGVGGVTRTLVEKGARVVAVDIGPQLAAATKVRCGCDTVIGTLESLGFRSGSFDAVVSSEAIEHTPDPLRSILELYRLVKPGGALVLSTPNRLWLGPVRAASALRVRPYDGYENFLWPAAVRRIIQSAGGRIVEHRGIHLWPFQIKSLHAASKWVDRFGDRLLPLMINQCVHCVKPI
jgi:2-polyprenyl-6-hydroxyphenyl methylase/3-demethylubiquinone-9 3-methyltransferase